MQIRSFVSLRYADFHGIRLGSLGPMVFAKDTGQGPLIGLFITAPLGMIMGAIGGYLYVSRQNDS